MRFWWVLWQCIIQPDWSGTQGCMGSSWSGKSKKGNPCAVKFNSFGCFISAKWQASKQSIYLQRLLNFLGKYQRMEKCFKTSRNRKFQMARPAPYLGKLVSSTGRTDECITGTRWLGIGGDGQAVCSPIKTPTFTACRTGFKCLYWHKFGTP